MHVPCSLEIPFLSTDTTEEYNYVCLDICERIFIIALILRTPTGGKQMPTSTTDK